MCRTIPQGCLSQRVLISLAVFCIALVGCYDYLIIHNASWTFSDEYQFVNAFLTGESFPLLIWKKSGRFMPLALQEYSLFRYVDSETAMTWMMVYCALRFSIFMAILYKTLKMLSNTTIAICMMLVFLSSSSSLYYTNATIIFSEPLAMLCLVLFVMFYLYGKKTDSNYFYIPSLITAIASTYMKETSFIIYTSFACMQLVSVKQMSSKEKYFYFLLLGNGIIFAIAYYAIVYGNVQSAYHVGRSNLSLYKSFFIQGLYSPLFFIAIVVFAIRLKKMVTTSITMADSLLVSGILFCAAYAVLGLQSSYYLLPGSLLFLLAFSMYLRQSANDTHEADPGHLTDEAKSKGLCRLLVPAIVLCSIGSVLMLGYSAVGPTQLLRYVTKPAATMLLKLQDEGYTLIGIKPDEVKAPFARHVINYKYDVINSFMKLYSRDLHRKEIELVPYSEADKRIINDKAVVILTDTYGYQPVSFDPVRGVTKIDAIYFTAFYDANSHDINDRYIAHIGEIPEKLMWFHALKSRVKKFASIHWR